MSESREAVVERVVHVDSTGVPRVLRFVPESPEVIAVFLEDKKQIGRIVLGAPGVLDRIEVELRLDRLGGPEQAFVRMIEAFQAAAGRSGAD